MKNFYVGNYLLDKDQIEAVIEEGKYTLVVAGAGSGKTLTIVGKVNYLIDEKNISPADILCISFTKEAVNSLKKKINNDEVDVMTFHKLALNILDNNGVSYRISETDYLEFIVHEFFFGIIYEDDTLMKKVLKYFDKFNPFCKVEDSYTKLLKNNRFEVLSFERLICKFIRLFKSNNYMLSSFISFRKRAFWPKEKIFLNIVLNVYLIYENELRSSSRIDFDDMLFKAIELINDCGSIKSYKYIIIDEFQDTSYLRYLLIKSIIDKTSSNLFVVGDDFQSIYKFNGCDLSIFLDFCDYFPSAKIIKIQNTYRNSIELIKISSKFILKNPNQIKKNLFSDKTNYKPLKICYGYSLKEIILMIGTNVMILSRNNKDIYDYIDDDFVYEKDKFYLKDNISIGLKYLTIHKSKGLEEENVIVLNVLDSIMGIPNKIEDSKMLKYVTKRDSYLYEEERRLFYVAITRCRDCVYLMSAKGHESPFIKEILNDSSLNIQILKKR